jgi:peptide/nickel transport system permease protein
MPSPLRSFFRKKLLRYLVIFIIVLTMNFVLPRLMPGDPVLNLFGEDALHANDALVAQLKAKYGLDQPLWVQFINYIVSLFHFDLGFSISKHMDVSTLISSNITNTLMLLIPALILSASLSLITGSWCGLHRGKRADRLLTPLTIITYCMPAFFLAMVVLSVFSFHLGWFPLGHQTSGGTEGIATVLDTAYHLILPITVLTIVGLVGKHLIVRNAVAQISNEDFILVARSKGYSEQTIVRRNILRNVLPQFISMVALNIGFLVEGAVLIEVIFSLNGMGTLLYNALNVRDYPVIQGCFLIITLTVLASNFVADLMYGLTDPRIRDSDQGVKR